MKRIVALLESMWGWGGYNTPGEQAPRYFTINPDNFSGRRLYRLCGFEHQLFVTNCCPIVQSSASHHGQPDYSWVRENLVTLNPFHLLLVCGKVSKSTYDTIKGFRTIKGEAEPAYGVIYMDHPAARRWSNEKLDATAKLIAERLSECQN